MTPIDYGHTLLSSGPSVIRSKKGSRLEHSQVRRHILQDTTLENSHVPVGEEVANAWCGVTAGFTNSVGSSASRSARGSPISEHLRVCSISHAVQSWDTTSPTRVPGVKLGIAGVWISRSHSFQQVSRVPLPKENGRRSDQTSPENGGTERKIKTLGTSA